MGRRGWRRRPGHRPVPPRPFRLAASGPPRSPGRSASQGAGTGTSGNPRPLDGGQGVRRPPRRGSRVGSRVHPRGRRTHPRRLLGGRHAIARRCPVVGRRSPGGRTGWLPGREGAGLGHRPRRARRRARPGTPTDPVIPGFGLVVARDRAGGGLRTPARLRDTPSARPDDGLGFRPPPAADRDGRDVLRPPSAPRGSVTVNRTVAGNTRAGTASRIREPKGPVRRGVGGGLGHRSHPGSAPWRPTTPTRRRGRGPARAGPVSTVADPGQGGSEWRRGAGGVVATEHVRPTARDDPGRRADRLPVPVLTGEPLVRAAPPRPGCLVAPIG